MKTKFGDIRASLDALKHSEVEEVYREIFPPPSKQEMIDEILLNGTSVQLDDLWHDLVGEFSESDPLDRETRHA